MSVDALPFSIPISRSLSRARASVVELDSTSKHSTPSVRAPSLRSSSPHVSAGDNVRVTRVASRSSGTIQPFDGVAEPPARATTAMTPAMLRREQLIFIAMCFPLFLAGWNDASAGPLIPRMQDYYHIGYVVVSMIFVCNCVGFVSAALCNLWLNERFGFGITICLGAACQATAYVIQTAKPPFPLFAISYAINGFGEGLQDAQSNGMVACLPTSAGAKMSILHGIYGVGAFASPLVATQFSHMGNGWSFHFLTSLGVGLVNLAALVWISRFRTQDAILEDIGVQPNQEPEHDASVFRQIMGLKLVHLMAFFILIYVGAEVTIGGWIVTFVLDKRGAGSGAGYVSSGFFGGLTIGRIALIWVNRKIGEQRVIYIYAVIAIALELTIWLVPSLYENAIAVSFVGVALGPFYPIVMNVASVLIPRRVLTGSIGWIASIGQTGSAAFPFVLGVMAEKYGVQTLQPLLVAMLASLIGIWFFVPSITRRQD